MAKVNYEEIKLKKEANNTLKDSLSYLLKQYNLNPVNDYGPIWAPSQREKEKLLRLILERKYYSYLNEIHTILKITQ